MVRSGSDIMFVQVMGSNPDVSSHEVSEKEKPTIIAFGGNVREEKCCTFFPPAEVYMVGFDGDRPSRYKSGSVI